MTGLNTTQYTINKGLACLHTLHNCAEIDQIDLTLIVLVFSRQHQGRLYIYIYLFIPTEQLLAQVCIFVGKLS